MAKTAYIAGKITGLPADEVKEKFSKISDKLKGMGYEVVAPLALTDSAQPWSQSIRSDIKTMLECDEIHMLPDWQDSRGAQLERDIAIRLDMEVVYH